jgi:hypothetical protein
MGVAFCLRACHGRFRRKYLKQNVFEMVMIGDAVT